LTVQCRRRRTRSGGCARTSTLSLLSGSALVTDARCRRALTALGPLSAAGGHPAAARRDGRPRFCLAAEAPAPTGRGVASGRNSDCASRRRRRLVLRGGTV